MCFETHCCFASDSNVILTARKTEKKIGIKMRRQTGRTTSDFLLVSTVHFSDTLCDRKLLQQSCLLNAP